MDDPSLLPFFNHTNGNGHHYAMEMDDDDDDDDEEELEEHQYPEDEIDDDEDDEEEILDEQEIHLPPPPLVTLPSQERGGRRKGVPRRLQISPARTNSSAQQRPLPASQLSTSSAVNSPPQDDEELNNENDYYHPHQAVKASNGLQFAFLSSSAYLDEEEYDENNNMSFVEDENVFETVDDILADIVTIIVRDIRQQRQRPFKPRFLHPTNGHRKSQEKLTNGKDCHQPLTSTKPSKKLSDPATLLSEFTKTVQPTLPSQTVKTKQPPIATSPPAAKRPKISEPSLSLQQQHQQLLWQMTQQLMMSNASDELTDNSSILKQQLLGLTSAVPSLSPSAVPKRVGRPPKQQVQSPQVMRSSTNMISSSYERANFAPRRRGRPPKYVTERGALPALPSAHELEPLPYDQLFAAIENSVTGNSSRTSAAAFQSALASMLGQQSGLAIPTLPIPPPPAPPRNGVPASMVKQSAGQTRHSLPSSSTNGVNMPLMATKKRGPGRPPKSQAFLDSHQSLQATKRISSPSSLSNNHNNNYPPTMVPSPPTSFNLNAAFVEMLQQQHLPR